MSEFLWFKNFLAVLCEITNYVFFIYSRKLTSHLRHNRRILMKRKGKQAHEHSQEKQKHTQDFRYPNLPQQLYVLLQLQLYLIIRKIYTEPFLLTFRSRFYIRSPLTFENRRAIYIQNSEVSPPLRGLTASETIYTIKYYKKEGVFNTQCMIHKIHYISKVLPCNSARKHNSRCWLS